MRHVGQTLTALVAAMTLLAATTALAGTVERHSGSVVSVDRATGAIVLAEVGPWKVRDGRTVVTEVRILVTDATDLVIVQRRDDGPTGFRGDFVEESLVDRDLMAGDYVTVDCEHRGGRMIARRIVVVSLP